MSRENFSGRGSSYWLMAHRKEKRGYLFVVSRKTFRRLHDKII